jgi:hypothetical protein
MQHSLSDVSRDGEVARPEMESILPEEENDPRTTQNNPKQFGRGV